MHFLIAFHAVLGEVGALAFLWVLVEMLDPNESRLRRARFAATLGLVCLIGSWFAGGLHYLTDYATAVKPLIKSGPTPWAHGVITETKEHVFLFLPFLAVLAWSLVNRDLSEFMSNVKLKRSTLLVAGLIVLLAFAMAGMGFIISSGFRAALEAKVL